MSKIAVHPVADEQSLPEPWITNLQNQIDQIREKAYELFEAAGKPNGQDLHHWMEAERLLLAGNGDIINCQDEFEIQISVPGFVAQELEISVLPDTILVHAETLKMGAGEVAQTQTLFRRFVLADPINTHRVSARLEKDVLYITAYKASAPIAMMSRAATA